MRHHPEPTPRPTVLRVVAPAPILPPAPAASRRAPAPSQSLGRRLIEAARSLLLRAMGRKASTFAAPSAWDQVTIHTDGSFHPDGGRMGWGAVICERGHGASGVLSLLAGGGCGGHAAQAEANAIAEALESLPATTLDVLLCTDCQSILNTLRSVLDPRTVSTRSRSRSRARDGTRAGLDAHTLARMRVAAEGRSVRFKWVRGHDGNPLNEAADILAAFGSGRDIPEHPSHLAGHPRARAAAIARRIHAAPAA